MDSTPVVAPAEPNASYPTIETKRSKTITGCLRNYRMFPILQELFESPREDPWEILIMGAGYEKPGFAPEVVELRVLLWDKVVNFTVVDRSIDVISIVRSGQYCFPGFDSGPLSHLVDIEQKRTAFDFMVQKASPVIGAKDVNGGSVLNFDVESQIGHNITTEICDFSAFEFVEGKYDILCALNSVYYLWADIKFQDHIVAYYKKMISSLRVGGLLFLDKVTFAMISDPQLPNVSLKYLGGYPIGIHLIRRTE